MISKFALATLVALAAFAPVQEAKAQESTLGGALFGGAAGAIVGGALGGGRGAAVGAIVGAGTGAAIGAQGEPRRGGYRWYQGACYVEQPGGWQQISPRYCGVQAQYAPAPRYYDDTPRYYDDTPRCMRSPTYNPRRGTFIGRDGYERPCP
ncbi:glycine zipper domain-containing protein [Bradyrhizobium sp.]|uniref:glycine zipper domain-containing protein n=1 Tax=Bradyrhizobium sp. TaxID=376 RepID=UPI0025C4B837|nr:glycine zipper domain-containing protein [Bradyrhizobium sp.]